MGLFTELMKSLFQILTLFYGVLPFWYWTEQILSKNKGNELTDFSVWVQPCIFRITYFSFKLSVILNGCIHRIDFSFFLSLREWGKVESSAFIYTYYLCLTLHGTISFKEKYFPSNVDKMEYSRLIWIQAINEMSTFFIH